MLKVNLKVQRTVEPHLLELEGEVGNISNLDAVSSYAADLEDRSVAVLENYPRWSESVRGLVARCIDLSGQRLEPQPIDGWTSIQVDIGMCPGGRGRLRPLSMARMVRVGNAMDVSWSENNISEKMDGVPMRMHYQDAWDLAEQALRLSTFGSDTLPEVVPLDIKIYELPGGMTYIRSSELPEPVRSVFEARQAHSSRPSISGARDAHFSWDWLDFLNGQR